MSGIMTELKRQSDWLQFAEDSLKVILSPMISISPRESELEDVKIFTGLQEISLPSRVLLYSTKYILLENLASIIARQDAIYVIGKL